MPLVGVISTEIAQAVFPIGTANPIAGIGLRETATVGKPIIRYSCVLDHWTESKAGLLMGELEICVVP